MVVSSCCQGQRQAKKGGEEEVQGEGDSARQTSNTCVCQIGRCQR